MTTGQEKENGEEQIPDAPLRWRQSAMFRQDDFWLGVREAPRAAYSISRDRQAPDEATPYFARCVVPTSDACPLWFATRDDAMGACECHVETDKWEPVKPVNLLQGATNDADAETMLKVLAHPLHWEHETRTGSIAYISDGNWYGIRKQDSRWQVVLARNGFFKGAHYPTRQDAKAACERHCLTGMWE